jgi:hypothetical protein
MIRQADLAHGRMIRSFHWLSRGEFTLCVLAEVICGSQFLMDKMPPGKKSSTE